MTAKEYLRQIERLDMKIRQNEQEYNALREMAASVSAVDYAAERVQTSPSADAIPEKVASYIELGAKLEKDKRQYAQMRYRIVTEIQSLDNALFASILYKRYVEYKSIREIAEELGYEYKWMSRRHGSALIEFQKKYLKK